MTEYSKMAKGSFVSSGAAKVINLPFQPDRIKLLNFTAHANFPASSIPWAAWDVTMGQGSGAAGYIDAGSVLKTAVLTSGGFSTFSAGLSQQFGPKQQVVAIPKANPTVVEVTGHGYAVGDTVVMGGLIQAPGAGMQQIAGIPFTITAVPDANHFTINWNTNQANYTAIAASPAGAYVMKVLYPFLYVPEDNVTAFITLGATTTVTTTMYHNFEVGQEIAFRIPTVYGTTQLNSLPNVLIPGSPVYGYVTSVTDNWTFVCSINSSAFTAFNTNQPFPTLGGLNFPQVLAVGDVNSGGQSIVAGGPLYPSPQFPTSSNRVPTINGPAIKGAFVNNTSQGFIIGTGNAVFQAVADAASHLVGAASDVIYWEAFYDDIQMP